VYAIGEVCAVLQGDARPDLDLPTVVQEEGPVPDAPHGDAVEGVHRGGHLVGVDVVTGVDTDVLDDPGA
jgi:hypothetical protein